MVMQKKSWMIMFILKIEKKLLQEICTKWKFSNKLAFYNPRWHGSHVILEAIKQSHQFWVRYDYTSKPYITCITTFQCVI
jgi:hypothetical protein